MRKSTLTPEIFADSLQAVCQSSSVACTGVSITGVAAVPDFGMDVFADGLLAWAASSSDNGTLLLPGTCASNPEMDKRARKRVKIGLNRLILIVTS
jgi:hypothetical protein